ncbi:MAG TPA: LLM class F420-dependent oxidoreductase [Actinomycetota bacterium]|jgi:F420-dependent oxidoreductase-like protein|nr:LLM class F420-dependent oxidoreductase [Actinomycetota bacterium]
MSVYFGYHMPSFSFPDVPAEGIFDHVVTLALAAEAAGFDHVTVMDHFYQIRGVGPETEPMLEAYTTLGGLAARTTRIRLGTLVTGVTYRNPALVAKMTATLDVMSSGRVILGVGAAWNEDEHIGYGFEFPPVGERMDRLAEALTIVKLMLTEERPSFQGRFYRIDRALNRPRPVQSGGPKILIGGTGERRTLRLVARYGDMSNFVPLPLDEVRRKLRALGAHCEAEGRDPSTILKTVMAPFTLVRDEREAKMVADRLPPDAPSRARPATPERAAEILGGYMDAGVQGFTFRNPNLSTPELIGLAGDLKKLLR